MARIPLTVATEFDRKLRIYNSGIGTDTTEEGKRKNLRDQEKNQSIVDYKRSQPRLSGMRVEQLYGHKRQDNEIENHGVDERRHQQGIIREWNNTALPVDPNGI